MARIMSSVSEKVLISLAVVCSIRLSFPAFPGPAFPDQHATAAAARIPVIARRYGGPAGRPGRTARQNACMARQNPLQ